MRTVLLNKIFDIEYGNSFELNKLEICDYDDAEAVCFVSRTRESNGISAYVKEVEDITPFEAGLITVAGSGNSVLESFVQPNKFYTAYHVFVLRPKVELSLKQKLFYCYCIRQNQFKYSYGRQANRTLKSLHVPSIDSIPKWIEKADEIKKPVAAPFHHKSVDLSDREWNWFKLSDLFEVNYGVNLELNKMTLNTGGIPFVSRTGTDNGVSALVDPIENIPPNPPNTISISGGGSVLECFVQDTEYYSGRDLFYLKPRTNTNVYVLLFVCTVVKQEKYRFNYGRQANKSLPTLQIKLPVTNEGKPDWQFMEYYIKSLPYSKNLEGITPMTKQKESPLKLKGEVDDFLKMAVSRPKK